MGFLFVCFFAFGTLFVVNFFSFLSRFFMLFRFFFQDSV